MEYLLGIITGILICLVVLVIVVYLDAKKVKIVERIVKEIEQRAEKKEMGVIFGGEEEETQQRKDYLEKNKGKDIPLNDIL